MISDKAIVTVTIDAKSGSIINEPVSPYDDVTASPWLTKLIGVISEMRAETKISRDRSLPSEQLANAAAALHQRCEKNGDVYTAAALYAAAKHSHAVDATCKARSSWFLHRLVIFQ